MNVRTLNFSRLHKRLKEFIQTMKKSQHLQVLSTQAGSIQTNREVTELRNHVLSLQQELALTKSDALKDREKAANEIENLKQENSSIKAEATDTKTELLAKLQAQEEKNKTTEAKFQTQTKEIANLMQAIEELRREIRPTPKPSSGESNTSFFAPQSPGTNAKKQ